MKRGILLLSILLLSLLVGCSGQTLYMCLDGTAGGGQIPDASKKLTIFCPDGSEVDDLSQCRFAKQASISKKDAENKAMNFVTGYVRSAGWSTTLVNVYSESGDYYGQIVVSKGGESSYETQVKIDGVKGSTTCEENCLYLTQNS